MLEKIPYQPAKGPSHPEAAPFIPTFLYRESADPPQVVISDDFYGARRKLRIGILGAGISGLEFLHNLFEAIPTESVEVVVYDKNEDVGGVWCSSHYPGARVDLPGPAYQFTWRYQVWTEHYPAASERKKYMSDVARENNFYQYIKLRHEVVGASWTDEDAKWTLEIRDLASGATFEDKIDLFLDFNGPVSDGQINVDGIGNFKGPIVHPEHWDDSIDLKGKRVALIGYGSSGVQMAPYLIKEVDKMYHWHRNKFFMSPPMNLELAGENGSNFACKCCVRNDLSSKNSL